MKVLICLSMLVFTTASFARCVEEGKAIASAATKLFAVNDRDVHCLAMGSMTDFKSLPVTAVMPRRHSYVATFYFPCGPQPRELEVKMLLNSACKISNIQMTGFDLGWH